MIRYPIAFETRRYTVWNGNVRNQRQSEQSHVAYVWCTCSGPFYYHFITNFCRVSNERIFKICQYLAKLYGQESWLRQARVRLGNALLRDEFAGGMTYGGQELLYHHHVTHYDNVSFTDSDSMIDQTGVLSTRRLMPWVTDRWSWTQGFYRDIFLLSCCKWIPSVIL